MAAISRVLPGRPVEDVPDNDPAFHTVFDLDHRYQISGDGPSAPAFRISKTA